MHGQEKQNRSCKRSPFIDKMEGFFVHMSVSICIKNRVARERRVAYVLKVAVFDEEHEKDLQSEINLF